MACLDRRIPPPGEAWANRKEAKFTAGEVSATSRNDSNPGKSYFVKIYYAGC